MSYPIFNKSESYKNNTFYPAFKDSNKWFVSAFNNGWVVNNPTIVADRTIINSRKDFIAPSDVVKEFSDSKGGLAISPIPVSNTQNNFSLNLQYGNEHSIKLNVVNDVPFPSLLFSATLLNTAPDYANLLADIKSKLAANNLLNGKLLISFQAISVQNRTFVKLNFKEILKDILYISGTPKVVQSIFVKLVYDYVNNNFDILVEMNYTPLNNEEILLVKDFISNKIQSSIVSNKTDQSYFDNGLTYSLFILRDPMELSNGQTSFDFYKSNLASQTVEL